MTMKKNDEVVEIPNGLSEEVRHAIEAVQVRGLDIKKAQELGAIDRISYMLCTMHALVCTAYRVFGQVDYMLNTLHGRKHDISKVCNQFEKDFTRFLNFWRHSGYQTSNGTIEMGREVETLYHNVMRWACLPENWNLGDEQHIEDNTDVMLRVEFPDRDLKFHRTTVESDLMSEPVERWCVTKLGMDTKMQETVYDDIDKASAMMSAKRLSAEDKDNIYTASLIRTVEERRTDVLPIKAYMGGDVVGKVGREFRG